MRFVYISENKIFEYNDKNITEIPCLRIEKYKETVMKMQKNKEWKTSGTGAKFMGVNINQAGNYSASLARITGICCSKGELMYSVYYEEVGGLYRRNYDPDDKNEGLIHSSNKICFGAFDYRDGKAVISMGSDMNLMHIGVMDISSGSYTEYTDGDTIEENPTWSADGKGIYFSTAGYARSSGGIISAVGPRSIAYLEPEKSQMDEIAADNKYDYLYPKEDSKGNLYYIRQNYRDGESDKSLTPGDILLFPYRLLKGVLGFLDFFTTSFGGESLKSGGNSSSMKSKQRSEREMFIDGNRINAEKLQKLNEARGEKYAGIMPLSRVLIKRSPDGNETVIKRGVLSYCLIDDDTVIISNGNHIFSILPDGNQEHIAKAKLAVNICTI